MTEASNRGSVRHGSPHPIPPEALLDPDPGPALAWADLDAWLEAHPCECEAECVCEEEGE